MKKQIRTLLATVLLSVAATGTVAYASDHWELTSRTYADNYHAGGLSDTYTGTVSVYGKDVIAMGQYFYYPTYSKLTYNVQGDITVVQVNSTGENDGIQRIDTKTVKDKWNFGSKTTCNYSFGTAQKDTNLQPYEDPSVIE